MDDLVTTLITGSCVAGGAFALQQARKIFRFRDDAKAHDEEEAPLRNGGGDDGWCVRVGVCRAAVTLATPPTMTLGDPAALFSLSRRGGCGCCSLLQVDATLRR
jgi:hypothetical protein